MRTWFLVPAALVALVTLSPIGPAQATRSQAPGADRVEPDLAHAVGHLREVRRIQAHFDSVLAELSARDASSLTATQRSRRTAITETLRAYRDRGRFPHNDDFPGMAMPYFVDRHTGILCAVAHLLESTGRRDIVDRVTAADNNVWVSDLAGDAPFLTWLEAQGFTLAEAARIQVPYMGDGNTVVQALGSRDNTYRVGTAFTVGTSALTALWNSWGNADGHRKLGTVLGFTTGALAMGFGGAALRDPRAPRYAAPVTLASGALSAFFSTRGLLRHRDRVAVRRDTDAPRRVARLSVAPLLSLSGKAGAGLSLSMAF